MSLMTKYMNIDTFEEACLYTKSKSSQEYNNRSIRAFERERERETLLFYVLVVLFYVF